MDNEDRQERIRQARDMATPHIRFRALAKAVKREAREVYKHFTRISLGVEAGETTARQKAEAMDVYSQAMGTEKDIDITILAILEPYEIDFAHSCAVLRKEIKRLANDADELANMSAEAILALDDDDIVDILFETPPKEQDKDNADG